MNYVSVLQWVLSPSRLGSGVWTVCHAIVSIPLWVFSPSRPTARRATTTRRVVSIPLWVFSPSRRRTDSDCRRRSRFQSRCGFSPRRDLTDYFVDGVDLRFNPVVGFLPVATQHSRYFRRRPDAVSIPLWVFSPSRPHEFVEWVLGYSFQSRCGFSPRRDTPDRERHRLPIRFNPVVGFLPVATRRRRWWRHTTVVFQSRCGFSPRRDAPRASRSSSPAPCFNPVVGFLPVATRSRESVEHRHGVSIPLWVFSPSRHVAGVERSLAVVFQSRCGFSPRRDETGGPREGGQSCFNPVVGFLPVATGRPRRDAVRHAAVSIPLWVFSPSRQGGPFGADHL